MISVSSRRAFSWTMPMNSRCSSVNAPTSPSSITSTYPMIDASGVRSSWETLDTKSVFS